MTATSGGWDGPILDNHFHLDPTGRMVAATDDFKRAGGTHLVLVHKPDFDNLPLERQEWAQAYDDTLGMAAKVRKQSDLDVRVVLGPHPAAWAHQRQELGGEVASELHLEAVEEALLRCAQGEAVGLGEVGRPHWEVEADVWDAANELLLEVLQMARTEGVAVQLHVEGGGQQTYSELAQIAHKANFPLDQLIRHHAGAEVSDRTTCGLIPSVVVGKGCIEELIASLPSCSTGFVMETDYMDDPRRPGAVLGPKTVPRRTKALAAALAEAGEDVEEWMSTIHQDLPDRLYGSG
jgi:TatD-related deoxyribonuclease